MRLKLLCALLLGPTLALAADLSKLDRTIKKEPAYKDKPLYCLLVFGPEAKTKAWLVLDGDTLYIDRYADGDLTQPDDRLRVHRVNQDPPNFLSTRTQVFLDVIPPGDPRGRDAPRLKSTTRYTRLWVMHSIAKTDAKSQGQIQQEYWQRLRHHYMNFFLVVDGQYKHLASACFGEHPQEAPILHFDGPLSLGFGNARPSLVREGDTCELKVCIETPGLGRDAVVTMSHNYAPPDVQPIADIEFPAKALGGKPIRTRVVLKERCRGNAFHGPVRVLKEAGKGKAKVRLSFDAWKEGHVAPATFEIPIEEKGAP